MNINKNELSKKKYLYRVYATEDKVIHCERYVVIYLNSEVVYYKDARKKEYLNYTKVANVRDKYFGITSKDLNHWGYYEKYFWKVENFNSKDATNAAFEQVKKDELQKAKSEYEQSEKEYLYKKEKYESLIANKI